MTTDRVVTVPNALTLLRLLGVPLFLWCLYREYDAAAIAVLMASGVTDWLDGKLAREWQQISRTGQLLDPVADRLYIVAALFGLTVRGIVPIWLTGLLVARDLALAGTVPLLRHHGYAPLEVRFLGKAATAALLYAFPLLLLGDGTGRFAVLGDVFGWAFALWGSALYFWSGGVYLTEVARLVNRARRVAAAEEDTLRRQGGTRAVGDDPAADGSVPVETIQATRRRERR